MERRRARVLGAVLLTAALLVVLNPEIRVLLLAINALGLDLLATLLVLQAKVRLAMLVDAATVVVLLGVVYAEGAVVRAAAVRHSTLLGNLLLHSTVLVVLHVGLALRRLTRPMAA